MLTEIDPHSAEARCHCGQLVAKLSETGVEVKCKRCKRIVTLPFSNLTAEETPFNPCSG